MNLILENPGCRCDASLTAIRKKASDSDLMREKIGIAAVRSRTLLVLALTEAG